MPGIADRKNAKDKLQKWKPQDFNAEIKVRIMAGGRTSTERSCVSNFTDTYTWTDVGSFFRYVLREMLDNYGEWQMILEMGQHGYLQFQRSIMIFSKG